MCAEWDEVSKLWEKLRRYMLVKLELTAKLTGIFECKRLNDLRKSFEEILARVE